MEQDQEHCGWERREQRRSLALWDRARVLGGLELDREIYMYQYFRSTLRIAATDTLFYSILYNVGSESGPSCSSS